MIDENKAVVFEKDEIKSRDLFTLIALLANQDVKFDAEHKVYDVWKRIACLKWKSMEGRFDQKKKQVELKNYEFENRGTSERIALFGKSGPSGFQRGDKNRSFSKKK